MKRFGISWNDTDKWYQFNLHIGKSYIWIALYAKGVKKPTYVYFDKEAVKHCLQYNTHKEVFFVGLKIGYTEILN